MNAAAGPVPRLSIVVPVRNEAGNILPLVLEIERTCASLKPIELIFVDDGSRDLTFAEISTAKETRSWLRVVQHAQSCGQSAAIRTGVLAARSSIVATLDGDGQNDPSCIPRLFQALEEQGRSAGLVSGKRKNRCGMQKRLQSRIANHVRNAILKDGATDSACGLKLFPRQVYLGLPFFDGLHRFMPALVKRDGFSVRMWM